MTLKESSWITQSGALDQNLSFQQESRSPEWLDTNVANDKISAQKRKKK